MLAKSLLMWVSGLIIFGTLLLQGGRAYFATNALASPALIELASDNCHQPCWQGVEIGKTIVQDQGQLPESNHFSVNYNTSNSGLVRSVYLYAKKPLLLGDLILLWGEPSHIVTFGTLLDYESIYTNNPAWATGVSLYFHDSLVIAHGVTTDERITPNLEITQITYEQPSAYGPPRPLDTPQWQGYFVDYPLLYVAGGE